MAANFKADQILTHFLGLHTPGAGSRMLSQGSASRCYWGYGIYALAPMIAAASR